MGNCSKSVLKIVEMRIHSANVAWEDLSSQLMRISLLLTSVFFKIMLDINREKHERAHEKMS